MSHLLASVFDVAQRSCNFVFSVMVIVNIGLVKKFFEPTAPPAVPVFHSLVKFIERGNIFGGFPSVKGSVQ